MVTGYDHLLFLVGVIFFGQIDYGGNGKPQLFSRIDSRLESLALISLINGSMACYRVVKSGMNLPSGRVLLSKFYIFLQQRSSF